MPKEKENSFVKQAVEGSFWEGLTSVIQRGGGLIFTIMLARFLLPEGFGLYSLAISITAIFFMFAQGGIDKTFIRYLAHSIKTKSKKNYFHYIIKIKLVALIVLSAVLVLVAYPLSTFILNKPSLFAPLLLAGLFTFVLSLDQFLASFFFVLKKVKYTTYKEIIYQIVRIVLLFIAFEYVYKNPSAPHAFIVLVIASLLALLYAITKVHQINPNLFKKGTQLSSEEKKKIMHFSFFISLASVSIVFLDSIDSFMLGWLIPDLATIGLYRASFVIMAAVSGLLTFSLVLLPIFTQTKDEELESVFNKTFRYLALISIPAVFGLIALGKYFIVLIYGHEYLGATASLYILSFLVFISIQVELFMQLFSAKEKPKEYLPLLLVILFSSLILTFAFVKYGSMFSGIAATVGAAVASVVSWSAYLIGMRILAKRKLGIHTNLTVLIKPLIASIIMFGGIVLINNLFGSVNLIKGLLLVIIGVGIYVAMLYILKDIHEEDKMVFSMVSEKFKKIIRST